MVRKTVCFLLRVLSFHLSHAAAAAKSLQSCPILCDPRDGDMILTSFLNHFSLIHLQIPTVFADFILYDAFKLHDTKAYMSISLSMNIFMSFLSPRLKNAQLYTLLRVL